jgi:hypothetical protein
MLTRDLKAGDTVFVRLPYEGGLGWATVRAVRTGAVDITFLPGEGPTYRRERTVMPRHIMRKETQDA